MRNFIPQTRQFNERAVVRTESDNVSPATIVGFNSGVFNDIPASNVPADGLYWSENYLVFPKRLEVRSGSKLWSTTQLPSLSGRSGYSLSKSGILVTKTVGANFVYDDIGRFITYDNGKRDKITNWIDANTVTVESEFVVSSSTSAFISDQVNCVRFHKKNRLFILHIGKKIYYSDVNISSWNEIYRHGDLISNDISCMKEQEDNMIIANKSGIYKIDLEGTPYVYWRMNNNAPSVLVTDVTKSSTKTYGYRYLYKMSKISGGTINRNRFGEFDSNGNRIGDTINKQESAPNELDENGKDYGTIFSERPVGEGETFYGILTGTALASQATDFDADDDAQFKISIDGQERNVRCNFTGVTSFAQMAEIIQLSLRDLFPDSSPTCEFNVDHFIISSPNEGGTVSYASAGEGGQDVGTSSLGLSQASGASLDNEVLYTIPITVRTLTMPKSSFDGRILQQYTHYSIYRTLDVGEVGINPITGVGNNSEFFLWLDDVPVAKSFIVDQVGTDVHANYGLFSKNDVGSLIKFTDGTTSTIQTFVDASNVTVNISASKSSIACCIGEGRVMTASQSGDTVTRTAGDGFSSGDVGKVIFWSNGTRSLIIEFVDANIVKATSNDVVSMAATLDPVKRNYYDVTRDDYNGTITSINQLRPRTVDSVYFLQDRFYVPLPDSDVVDIIGMFMFCGIRGDEKVYYSTMQEYKSYLLGNYHEGKQYTILKDKVSGFSDVPEQLCVFCSNSTYAIPTNNYIEDLNQATGNVVFVVSNVFLRDSSLGCTDWGSIAKVNEGTIFLRTNDNEMRFFDGNNYSESTSKNRISKKIAKLDNFSTGAYHPIIGYSLWSKSKKDTSIEEKTRIIRWYDQYDADNLYYNQYSAELVKKDTYSAK